MCWDYLWLTTSVYMLMFIMSVRSWHLQLLGSCLSSYSRLFESLITVTLSWGHTPAHRDVFLSPLPTQAALALLISPKPWMLYKPWFLSDIDNCSFCSQAVCGSGEQLLGSFLLLLIGLFLVSLFCARFFFLFFCLDSGSFSFDIEALK